MKRALSYLAVLLGLVVTVFPTYWIVISAFKTRSELFQQPPTFFPEHPTLENFRSALGDRGFGRFLFNSFVVASVSTALALAVGTLAAYSLARLRLPWKLNKHLAFWILSTRMIPPIVAIIPTFILFRSLHLLNSYRGLILIYAVFNLPFVVWLLMGFLRELPPEIEEAALADGDHRLGVLWRIVLPLIRPALAATAVLTLILTWNEFIFALTLISSTDRITFPVATSSLVTQFQIIWGDLLASAVVAAVPILIFTLLVQKHLVRGLTMGALKG